VSDWNQDTIEEFRINEGNVGGVFQGAPLLLLHHVGAKTGTARVSPLMYQAVDGGYAVFASKGGADSSPDWYYNLRANPDTKVEVGTDVVAVAARVVEGDERVRIWEKQKQDRPQFADYELRTTRETIPVLVLDIV
jgi:deazaflavin-dependent oxidoreductase (nitroreductase family)